MSAADETEKAPPGEALAGLTLVETMPSVHVAVVDGPDRGLTRSLSRARLSIGTHAKNDLVLGDATVSRFHCELVADDGPLRVRDLGSTNGTFLDAVPVVEGYLRAESTLRLGATTLSIRPSEARGERPVSARSRFGRLVGRSVAMRSLFSELERAAGADATVLVTGETGTGKDEAALSLHEQSARADGPFVTVDCGALGGDLAASELFGHERGAFTDAVASRPGAFEVAHGGTLFLDEIGELPLADQARLLRVIETRTVRRVGGQSARAMDVRIVAATHVDLRRAINEGRFREDLYYRLAVVEVRLPPLRERAEDIPLLARTLLERIAGRVASAELLDDSVIGRLVSASWPGNVRQLRNYLERLAHLRGEPAVPGAVEAQEATEGTSSYDDARKVALDEFERRYLAALLAGCDDNVTLAARRAGLNRSYLHRLLRRHRLRD